MHHIFTMQSSEPLASSVGSISQKSTHQMRFEWASYSHTMAAVVMSHSVTTPACVTGEGGGGRVFVVLFLCRVCWCLTLVGDVLSAKVLFHAFV